MNASMESSLVSCIVPVFNGERYLAEALESIFAQTYRPIEVVVVDDGSADATPDILRGFGDRIVARRQENSGPAAARNNGIRASRGSFLAFLDADDLWAPEKLERQMQCFAARPEADCCVTGLRNFWIDELEEERSRFAEHRISQQVTAYLASTLLARRRLFDTAGLFDETLLFAHSTEWFTRVKARGCLCEVLPEVLYHRRMHLTNRSRQFSQASREEFLRLVKDNLDRKRQLQSDQPKALDPPGKRSPV